MLSLIRWNKEKMMIIVYILAAILAFFSFKYSRDFLKRRKLMRTLRKLEAEVGGKLTVHKNPYKSLFKLSASTEITFETEDSAYHIRLVPSFGFYKRIVHFASPEYIVSFRRFKFVLVFGHSSFAISHGYVHQDGFNYGCRVRIMPPHNHVMTVEGKKNIDVYLFNPTPHTVSYVTPEKTSIRMARVDAEIFGNRVFTGSTFYEYIYGKYVKKTSPIPEKPTFFEEARAAEKIEEKAFTPPSFADFAYEEHIPAPKPEYPPFTPKEKSEEITSRVKLSLIILAALEILITAFTVLSCTVFNRNGTLLFVAMVLYIANAMAGATVNSKLHLFMHRGKTYEAVVVNKAEHTPIRRNNVLNYPGYAYHVYPKGYLKHDQKPRFGGAFSVTVKNERGARKKIYLATKEHFNLYLAGDRILKYAGLPYPLIISREARRKACPACGAITEWGDETCLECALIFPKLPKLPLEEN